MDTGKLLKVISDIRKDESEFSFQSRFSQILTYYNEPNREALNSEKEAIYNDINKGILANYNYSDSSLMKQLGIKEFFGIGSHERLDQILGSQSQDTRPLLEEFIAKRQDQVNRLNSLFDIMSGFGVNARELGDDEYEIGFSLPVIYTDLDKLQEAIADINNFLNGLSSAAGEQAAVRVKYVSNGTLELFLSAGLTLVVNFNKVLEFSLKIYHTLSDCDEIIEKAKAFTKAKTRRKTIENGLKKESQMQVDKLIDEMIKELGIKEHDHRNRVKGLFVEILKHIEAGIIPEVRVPELHEPKELGTDATSEQKKEYKTLANRYERNMVIQNRNREILKLEESNFYGTSVNFLKGSDADTIAR
ncbi:MAG: hypothetical protein ABSD10_03945 [Candidatus Saccharimonadales bacterium]|jgi:hypothetical protein